MLPIFLWSVIMTQNIHQIAKQIEAPQKPSLLVVGFYHFQNPKLDVVKTELDDHLSSKRQAEIVALVKCLARFKPTKIAVEAPFQSTATNERYAAWLKDSGELTVDETQQVGFRLAKQFGHKQLYPIDHKMDLDFDPLMALAAKSLPDKMKQIQTMFGAAQKMNDGFKSHTVLENLRLLNDPEADRLGNGMYLRMATVVKDDQHPGADMAAQWWKRNMIWIGNLSTVATESTDRVLVICGGGHASLIRSILRDSLDFKVVPTLDYLH